MKFWCAALAALLFSAPLFSPGALAQGVPRIRARILSFDGQTLTVTSGAPPQTMTVGLNGDARIMRQEKRGPGDIAVGNYIGATVTTGKDGILHAQEVHIFPEELRGSSEGVFPAAPGHSMIDGTVTAVGAVALSVSYRGGGEADGPTCTGRAPRLGGCHGSADFQVAPGVPVTALLSGDKSLLIPGAVIALSVMAGPDGRPVTPGLTVEIQTEETPAPAAASHAPKAR